MTEAGPKETVDEAINRVLKAEKEARQAVENCRFEARRIVNRARIGASRILERADDRMGLMHRRCEQSVGHRLSELRAEARRIPTQPVLEPDVRERLEAMVRRLAEEMIRSVSE